MAKNEFATKSVAVSIVFRNASQTIKAALESVNRQAYGKENIELILVDGCSTDNSVEIVERFLVEYGRFYARTVLLENPNKNLAAGWNLAINQAQSGCMIRFDAHSELSDNYVSELYQKSIDLEGPSGVVIGGCLDTIPRKKSPIAAAIVEVLTSRLGVGGSPFRVDLDSKDTVFPSDTAAYALYAVSDLKSAGLFNEHLARVQDLDMHKRLRGRGVRFFTMPAVLASYKPVTSIWTMYKKAFGTGFGVVQSKSGRLRHFAPLAYFFAILLSVLLILFLSPSFLPLVLFAVGCEILLLSLTGLSLLASFIIPGFHFSYGFGEFVGFVDLLKNYVK